MFLFPLVFPESYWITVFIYVGIYGLVVVGYDLLLGYCGQISQGQNAQIANGAYATANTTTRIGWSPIFGIDGAICITKQIALSLKHN